MLFYEKGKKGKKTRLGLKMNCHENRYKKMVEGNIIVGFTLEESIC